MMMNLPEKMTCGESGGLERASLCSDPSAVLAVIYDCDGVLVDSREANIAYYNHILAHFGMPPLRPDQLDKVQVLSASGVIEFLFEGTGLIDRAQVFERSLVDHRFLDLTYLEPHITDTLRILRVKRRTAVVSNRGKSLRPLLACHGIESLFDVIVGSGDVVRQKPDPEPMNKVMSSLSLRAEHILYIGDSDVDRILCRRAGAPFVSYKNPALDALFHINDHFEILKILAETRGLSRKGENSLE